MAAADSPRWSQVENHCRALVDDLPQSFAVRHLYGKYLLKAERFPDASQQFRESLQNHKGHVASRIGLATALWKLKKFKNAESEFRSALSRAVRTGGATAPIQTALGWLYIDWQRWLDARLAFETARNEAPDYAGNYWGIGRAEFELGNYASAAESLRRALSTTNLKPPASDEIPALLEKCLTHLKE
ncbi:MAG: tetratricopeptide repeat protein [Proteobacteria bacterium]|nr:tetratricopeptide repeat protein [Pseudomonadota bacterium]